MNEVLAMTVQLDGSEIHINRLKGSDADIRNDGTDWIYVSDEPNIVPGADGVMSIPPNQAVHIADVFGNFYITGHGQALIVANDYDTIFV